MHGGGFLVELGAVMLGLALLARVAGRFGFSPIPLYLLFGLSFGDGGVLPLVTSESFVEAGAEIGVVLLLFMLGLEFSGKELMSSVRSTLPAGSADLVLNAAPGVVAGLLLGFDPVAAVLLGGITYMSSTGVIAKMVGDFGWVGNRETPAVLSLLVVEDLLMAAYLPIVAVLLRGGSAGSVALAVGIAIGAALVVLFVATRWGESLSRFAFTPSDETLMLTIFGLVLAVAGITESLQVSAAVGAFLIGLALSGETAERTRVLFSPVRDLFAAVFFVFFGLRIDPGDLPPVVGAALLLALVTSLTKVATGWLAASRSGVGVRGRLRAGGVLIARGEFSIAIAEIGLAAGLPSRFASLAAAYVLVLALAGPMAARVLDWTGSRVAKRPRVGA